MFKCDYVEYQHRYSKQFRKVKDDYSYVRLAKKAKKGYPKILFVLDYVPTEDLRSGRLLSGATGELLANLLKTSYAYYGGERDITDYSWMAVAFNAFKTAGQTEQFVADAKLEFAARLRHIICEYKPAIVVTFGLDPYKALNGDFAAQFRGKRGIVYEHFYGVPIDTEVKSKDSKHKCLHVPTLGLNPLVTSSGKGEDMYLAGYVMRNLQTVLNGGQLRYAMPKLDFKIELVDTIEKFDKMYKVLRKAKYIAIDTECKNLNRIVNKTLTIQFAVKKDKAYIVPIGHKDSTWLPDELKYVVKKIRKLMESDNEAKYMLFANAVFDLNRMRADFGVRHFKANVWDVFAGEFGLDENLKVLESKGGVFYTLLNICMQYGCRAYYESDFGKDKRTTIDTEDLHPALLNYCALDVITLLHIRTLQMRRAKDIGYDKYESLVGEQISDMLHMFNCLEHNGCPTDIQWLFYLKSKDSPILKHRSAVLKELSNTKGVRKANDRLTKKSGASAIGLFGKTKLDIFDIGKQDHQNLLMFDVLKLKPLSTGKKGTGNIDKKFQSTYADVPEVALYNELQKIKKIFSSYVKAFVKQWGEDADMRSDSRIRPYFQFRDVVTGRTSAKKPSLHQLPSRNEITAYIKSLFPERADLGKIIKRMFIAPEGRIILKIDYAAHEVRGWSIISGDMEVAQLFQHGLDMRNAYKLFPVPELADKIDKEGDPHKINAAYFFSMPIAEVDKPKRNSVKQVIFGLIYQQGMEGVANSTGQTLDAIKDLVKRFFKRFPIGAGWFDKIKTIARKQLFVQSPLGRRRNLWPFIMPKSAPKAEGVIAATERRAVNSPIQGMGSDFLVSGERVIEKQKWEHYEKTGHYPDFFATNSVHDSLEFSVAYEDFWLAIRMIEYGLTAGVMKEMERRHGMTFTVPLEIDFEIGGNIADAGGWDYSIDKSNGKSSIEHLVRKSLEFQRDELKHNIDVDKLTKKIVYGQYENMPAWAQKQLWNTGKKVKGMGDDPRRKSERLNAAKQFAAFKLEKLNESK